MGVVSKVYDDVMTDDGMIQGGANLGDEYNEREHGPAYLPTISLLSAFIAFDV